MDDEDTVVRIEHEHHLHQASSLAPTPDQPFPILTIARIGVLGRSDDTLGLLRRDPMRRNMLDVPPIPSEEHSGLEFLI